MTRNITIAMPDEVEDPVVSVWRWREDSQTLARVRPVLERLRQIEDQPCQYGPIPYMCARTQVNRLCGPCALRDIRAALFGGEQPTEGEPHE